MLRVSLFHRLERLPYHFAKRAARYRNTETTRRVSKQFSQISLKLRNNRLAKRVTIDVTQVKDGRKHACMRFRNPRVPRNFRSSVCTLSFEIIEETESSPPPPLIYNPVQ